jgi:endonuclease/exonuclease/phosphatase family metal-dependent hydrolase
MAWILIILGLMVGLLVILVWAITFHPATEQTETVICAENAPVLQSGQTLKLLTYNIQYMAGKNYVFFYDLPNDAGPDERPSSADMTQSINEVAHIIQDEDPDIILLQEVDDGSKRTDYEDQLARLLSLLPDDYACHTSAFYWQAAFVPHRRIMGAIGHKLSIISKYRLEQATRYQLPLAPADLLTQQFSPKRAILEARLPVEGDQDFVVLNTHLEVSNRGTGVKQAEIAQIDERLTELNRTGQPWLLGGDFNLLPPGQFKRLSEDQRGYFRPETELRVLFDKYQVTPSFVAISSDQYQQWLTMFPNDPRITQPDRTLDYFFFADDMTLADAYVRQDDTLQISDHLPVVAKFQLP